MRKKWSWNTSGVIPCAATFGTEPYSEQPVMPTSKIEGLKKEGTLHMDHKLTLFRPIPTEGNLTIDKVISGVYDRGEGKGAKIQVEITASDEKGEKLFTNTMGYLNRWAGGFGGEKPPASRIQIPDRAPDLMAEDCYPDNTPCSTGSRGTPSPSTWTRPLPKGAALTAPSSTGCAAWAMPAACWSGSSSPGSPSA